ncbi:2TM domain-containing protein [Aquimarina sp. 2201CG5-10]|uniref:2TM domain-containing protein n=1 Tax=Aquimarina callyspongiae TaxID=3098150 RepID=UPI002AB508A0|nr:2TM domain-containing protein [Aquimarina sp. 2201CG5-10]MDY8137388.1 2TM domain-containing protein [Aquimarina sp. 2201CG5-10]
MNSDNERIIYEKAKKRVEEEKGFYIHIVVYIVINLALFFFKQRLAILIDPEANNEDFRIWWNWSNIITPLAWGIGLFFHWLWAFKKTILFNNNWEEKKIKKIMEEDDIIP